MSYLSGSQRGAHQPHWLGTDVQGNHNNRTNDFCKFCNIHGYPTQDYRKLAGFLRDNNVNIDKSTTPIANVTTSVPVSLLLLFDIGAWNHVISNKQTLHNLSKYNGPNEIVLGEGTSLHIFNISNTHIDTPHKRLLLTKVLHVPRLHRNLVFFLIMWH